MKNKRWWRLLTLLVLAVILGHLEYVVHPESRKESGDSISIKQGEDERVEILTNTSLADSGSNADESSYTHLNWWKTYVEEVSVIYTPSNNTEWCQNLPGRRLLEQDENFRADIAARRRDMMGKKPFMTPTDKHKWKERRYPKTGIYLVKTMKTASSTAAAVTLQIAKSVARQKGYSTECPHHVHHGEAYVQRQSPFFLWTILREPASRSVSEYFFEDISRRNHAYNSTRLIQFLRGRQNNQLKYIGLQKEKHSTMFDIRNVTNAQVATMVKNILNSYHFIAITERLDESLVVMKLLYGFEDAAMVALSSKRSGGFDDGNNGEDHLCRKIQKAYTTPDVDEYIASGFQKGNYDYLLYAAANRSLDKTIDMLGREYVEREVERHRALTLLAEEQCLDQAVFPCVQDNAKPQVASFASCFFGDVGCGHECVERVLQQELAGGV